MQDAQAQGRLAQSRAWNSPANTRTCCSLCPKLLPSFGAMNIQYCNPVWDLRAVCCWGPDHCFARLPVSLVKCCGMKVKDRSKNGSGGPDPCRYKSLILHEGLVQQGGTGTCKDSSGLSTHKLHLDFRFRGVHHAFLKILSEGGVRGLWAGWVPNVQRAALVNMGGKLNNLACST